MEELSSESTTGSIARVLVYHVPEKSGATAKATMEDVVHLSPYMYEITSAIDASLNPLFQGIAISNEIENYEPDLCWGLICVNDRGQCVSSAFVDASGEHGYLNKSPVRFHVDGDGSNLARRFQDLTVPKMKQTRPAAAPPQIASVLIFHAPVVGRLIGKVDMERLLHISPFIYEIKSEIGACLEPLLAGITVVQEICEPDLRFGLICFDDQGRGVSSTFVDASGDHGYVDKVPVRFEVEGNELSLPRRFQDLITSEIVKIQG